MSKIIRKVKIVKAHADLINLINLQIAVAGSLRYVSGIKTAKEKNIYFRIYNMFYMFRKKVYARTLPYALITDVSIPPLIATFVIVVLENNGHKYKKKKKKC